MSVSVDWPSRQLAPDKFAVVVSLGDWYPIRKEGAHYATLLRRGTYTVEVAKDQAARILTYEEACCSQVNEKAQ